MVISEILERAERGVELTFDEGVYLYNNVSVSELAISANKIRNRIKGDDSVVTWQIDRNINITNVCISGCKFCNFHCKPHQTDKHFITTIEQYIEKIDELYRLGGDQILLQGGLHPKLDIVYYENLFKELKRLYPTLKIHALGPPEIFHIAKISNLSVSDVLARLVEAGLSSLPGAGAEILDTPFRKQISPGKCSAEEWVEVMKIAHKMGLSTSATMVYGINETVEQRVAHILKIREIQSQKPEGSVGFIAFIAWCFSTAGTRLEKEGIVSHFSQIEYIKLIAISRILLQNVANIQASWLTVGRDCAQIALHSGANDLGSIMIEENVVASTGLHNKMDSKGMQKCIKEAGFTPRLRDQLYNFRNCCPIKNLENAVNN